MDQAKRQHTELSKEALYVGSKVHKIIEWDLKHDSVLCGKDIFEPEQIYNALLAYLNFRTDYRLEPEKLEFTVDGNGWAGTMDFKGYLDGKKTLLDWKTSKSIYMDSYCPQIAAYWVADNRWAEQAGIVRFDKETAEYEIKILKPKRLEYYYNIFECMANLYFIKHPIIAKKAGRLL